MPRWMTITKVLKKYVDKNGPIPIRCPELGQCWIWTGTIRPDGYGQIGTSYKTMAAHRYVYIHLVGKIPSCPCPKQETMHLHHKCKTPLCVNPNHLELTTEAEHPDSAPAFMRGRLKKHCIKGHEFTPENTGPNGGQGFKWRRCKKCHAENERTRLQNHREAAKCL